MTALDILFESIYKEDKETLLSLSPLDMEILLENLGEGMDVEEQIKSIAESYSDIKNNKNIDV